MATPEYARQYYQDHKEKMAAYGKEYRARNLERERERNRKYRETHQEQIRAYRKKYYQEVVKPRMLREVLDRP